jgi:hypothetical protein
MLGSIRSDTHQNDRTLLGGVYGLQRHSLERQGNLGLGLVPSIPQLARHCLANCEDWELSSFRLDNRL